MIDVSKKIHYYIIYCSLYMIWAFERKKKLKKLGKKNWISMKKNKQKKNKNI